MSIENKEGNVDQEAMLDEVLGLYDTGWPQGDSTGWPCLDPYYTVLGGQWTVVTGMPGCGKSEFLDAMMVNLAERDPRWMFCLYSPENFPESTHLAKLVEKVVRKPFGLGPTPRMTKLEAKMAMLWLFDHFVWMDPALRTPDGVIENALTYMQDGRKMGVVLDPWNTLDHERGGRSETDYISYVLTDVTRMARASMAHIWLVAHPQKILKDRDGKRPVPTPYDISGSAHWFNKADNILCVHREKGEATQEVDIHVQKVRFKFVGKVGMATLRYDNVIGRYFDLPGVPGEFYADPERRA